jgi:flagellar protein FliO/FliZ
MPSYAAYLVETFVTLLAVCALAIAVLWGARRLGVGRPNGPLDLVGHLPLDARRAVYLVRVGGQVFVIGTAEGGMTKLGEIPAGELPTGELLEGGRKTAAFRDILARVRGIGGESARGGGSESVRGDGRES